MRRLGAIGSPEARTALEEIRAEDAEPALEEATRRALKLAERRARRPQDASGPEVAPEP